MSCSIGTILRDKVWVIRKSEVNYEFGTCLVTTKYPWTVLGRLSPSG